jgi:hypothetical protein
MKTITLLLAIFIVTAALAIHVHAQSFLTNGLVAYYPLNGNANDATGNGNDGFAENTVTTTNQVGQPNSALLFTGSSWVYIPYSASMLTTNYSVSLVFNAQADFADFCLLRSGNASNDGWRGYAIGGGGPDFGFQDFSDVTDSSSAALLTPNANWQENQWYNLIFTRNGTTAQLYVNGVLIASATNTPPYTPAQSSPIYIGSDCPDPAPSDPTVPPWYFFTGIIYDARFYNRGLSASEAHQLYVYESQLAIVSLIKAVKPSFSDLILTTNYQLQVSTDMINWTNQGTPFTATNTSMVYPQYFDVGNWNSLFFRLQVAP